LTLMLHAGAAPVEYDALRELPTPPATQTHVPIPHYRVVDLIAHSLAYYGHHVTDQHFGITPDGARFFGVLCLRSDYTGYTDMVGLRNSHDRKFPVGISFGNKCFVCDNLAFIGDHVIKRKHTAHLKRDLPGLIGEVIEPLAIQREAQKKTFDAYRATALTDQHADAAIMQMYRRCVINVQRIPDVLHHWDEPEHDFGEKTAWRLFNAATSSLQGRVAECPKTTTDLHEIIDASCAVANLVH
jgi:hypothetical protein